MPEKAGESPLVVGRFNGVYGVQGWLKVYSWTQPRENILTYNPWLIRSEDGWQRVKVLEGRRQGKGIVVKLEGVQDRDQALALRDIEVAIDRDQLPELPEGEYYWSDLLGLEVVNTSGHVLGKVESLMETGADDVLVVQGDVKRLIPFTEPEIVKLVDHDAGRIVVDWEADYLQE